MKTHFNIMTGLAALLVIASCDNITAESKREVGPNGEPPIHFFAGVSQDTRVTAVTSLDCFQCVGTKKTAATESQLWNSIFTKDTISEPHYYKSGTAGNWTYKFWPNDNTAQYNFYACNSSTLAYEGDGECTFTVAAGTEAGTADKDYVAAYINGSYGVVNTLTFHHVLARIGNVTLTPTAGYTATNVVITVTNPVTTPTICTVFSMNMPTSNRSSSGLTLAQGANDKYVIPATVNLEVSYTLTKDGASRNFTQTASISLMQGKINNLTGILSPETYKNTITVQVEEWDSTTPGYVWTY